MQNRCCVNICFFNNSSNTHAHQLLTKMILCNFISLQVFIYCLHEKLTAVRSFTSPELIWMQIMKLPYTKVKFYPKVKSQTGLSSFRVSCKRALNQKTLSSLLNDIISFLLNQISYKSSRVQVFNKLVRGYGKNHHTHVSTLMLKW